MTAHLVQSTLFALAVALLTLGFRNNRAHVRFCLWMSASLKFLFPFALLIGLGARFPHPIANQDVLNGQQKVLYAVRRLAAPFPSSLPQVPQPNADWLPIVWACGFVSVAALRLRGWLRIRAAVRGGLPLEPGVIGIFRPIIILPEGISERLTPDQLEAVLAHELCHIRRHDNLFASLHMIVEALFWFHPMVWWIGAKLIAERERACDEAVLMLGNQPRTYADAILGVCKLYLESPLACVSGVTGSALKHRIEAIMTNHTGLRLNRAKKLLLASAGAASIAGPIAMGLLMTVGHLPVIHAQQPQPAALPVAKNVPRNVQQAFPSAPGKTAPATAPHEQQRLIALLFDFASLAPDQQTTARTGAVMFVNTGLKPTDRVAVLFADSGKVSIAQDFTADPVVLTAAILRLPATGARLADIESTANLLGVLPGKKSLMYYSGAEWGLGDPHLQSAIAAAQKASLAIYPIDARGLDTKAPPAQDRLAKLTPQATFAGRPLAAGTGLPAGDASVQTYNSSEAVAVSVPLASLSGQVDILGQIKSSATNRVAAVVRDVRSASGEAYSAVFMLKPGSYVGNVTVKEQSTGRTFQETIDFEVK
jgi:hypothetical protein